jgi:hypothetical protein
LLIIARFEVFKAVKIKVKVFWVVTPCNVVTGYQSFRSPCCLHLQVEIFWVAMPHNVVVGYQRFPEDGGSMDL